MNALLLLALTCSAEPLPGTKPLDAKGDLAADMVAGIDKYLTRELAASPEKRKALWKPDYSSPEAYAKSVEPNRQRLRQILGVVDERKKFDDIEYVGGPKTPSLVAETDLYKVHAIRWPVLEGIDGEGLLLEPKGKLIAQVVAIPDADWTPEMLVGLAPGVAKESQFARRLAENGCRVVVPVLINRKDDLSGNAKLNRWTNQPHREFVYRAAYEMGRHIIGYEVQKVLAAVDWFVLGKDHPRVGVIGYGEGAAIAMYAAALDQRISGAVLGGYVGSRERVWEEPIDRNVWSFLSEFGDEGVCKLILPRLLVLDMSDSNPWSGPIVKKGRTGAAPGKTLSPYRVVGSFTDVNEEISRATDSFGFADGTPYPFNVIIRPADEPADVSKLSLSGLLRLHDWLTQTKTPFRGGPLPVDFGMSTTPIDSHRLFDPAPRHARQFHQLITHTQKLWRDSEALRDRLFAHADFSSPAAYNFIIHIFATRKYFDEEVIGKLPASTVPMNPRSRPIYDTPKWTGHEVTLDLHPDVFAYGILLLPKDIKPGEKRPVVVCQHGLEGRPQDVCNPKERTKYYNSFGAQLADRGYIVFAPQNPYIGEHKFRVLQRKANPLKLSLFSFIVRQHERILEWLATHPNVDAKKMAFYGLSYGGKTAMRVPAILPQYCLSICSGDFNEWIGKNVSVDFRGSYMFTGEYEMPEFNLGHTFNYAEMAYLIAPRPFMVERGHDDFVGTDEMVAYEYAKVRRQYARLKLPQNTEIEWFAGGHEIRGAGTFAFLQRHLGWPR